MPEHVRAVGLRRADGDAFGYDFIRPHQHDADGFGEDVERLLGRRSHAERCLRRRLGRGAFRTRRMPPPGISGLSGGYRTRNALRKRQRVTSQWRPVRSGRKDETAALQSAEVSLDRRPRVAPMPVHEAGLLAPLRYCGRRSVPHSFECALDLLNPAVAFQPSGDPERALLKIQPIQLLDRFDHGEPSLEEVDRRREILQAPLGEAQHGEEADQNVREVSRLCYRLGLKLRKRSAGGLCPVPIGPCGLDPRPLFVLGASKRRQSLIAGCNSIMLNRHRRKPAFSLRP